MQNANEPIPVSPPPILPIRGWEEFLADGQGYLRTASRAFAGDREAFTPEILYNLVAMAIEKFVMAGLMFRGALPCNHTMADLVEAMEESFPHVAPEIREELLRLDAYQDICDPYHVVITAPARDEIPQMLALATKLKQLVANEITGGL